MMIAHFDRIRVGACAFGLSSRLLAPGMLASASRGQDAEKPDAAIAAVQKAGGKIDREEKAPGKPVVTVNLGTTGATDADLEGLKGFDKLKKLMLNGTK